jgi:hypothetical protein
VAPIVKAGLVASFNRPGGNITGASFVATELETKRLEILHDAGDWDTHQPDQSGRLDTGREIGGKRLQILKEAVPSISKVALLDLNTPNYERQFAQPLLELGRRLNISLSLSAVISAGTTCTASKSEDLAGPG